MKILVLQSPLAPMRIQKLLKPVATKTKKVEKFITDLWVGDVHYEFRVIGNTEQLKGKQWDLVWVDEVVSEEIINKMVYELGGFPERC